MEIEKIFCSNPESWFSAIILNDNGNQVYGKVKNGLALIESLPDVNTGYHFKDIVKVNITNSKQLYKDDYISEYKVKELYSRSGNFTFQFKAIISNTSEYFDLQQWFVENNQISSLIFKTKYEKNEWNICFCSAKNLAEAHKILTDFQTKVYGKWYDHIVGEKKSNFQFKELLICE
jgi:hypothetical protein